MVSKQKVYNPLKRWLRGVKSKMPVFIDCHYNGYKVSVRPRDKYRVIFRFSHWYLLPYLDGSILWLNLKIESSKTSSVSQEMKCTWRFKRFSDNELFGQDESIITMLPNKPETKEIFSNLILDSTKYTLEVKLDTLNPLREGVFQTIALFTVQDRDNFYSQFVWFFAGAIILIVGTILGTLLGLLIG